MTHNETTAALERIEKVLAKADSEQSFRPALIATLFAKRYTLREAALIARKQMLGCSVRDMNLTLALHYGLKIRDLRRVSTDANLVAIIKRLDDDIPRTLLNGAIRDLLLESKKLVAEITTALASRKDESPERRIRVLFDGKTCRQAVGLLKQSYPCMKFPYGMLLEFTRRDGSKTRLEAEYASTPRELETGFEKRPWIPSETGMWYDLGQEKVLGFVTTGTPRPFSVAYVSEAGRILEIVKREADDSEKYWNKEPARFVLEVPFPWFDKNGIREGDTVKPLSVIVEP